MFFGVTELSPLNHQYAVDWTAKLKDLAIKHHVIHVDCDKKKMERREQHMNIEIRPTIWN